MFSYIWSFFLLDHFSKRQRKEFTQRIMTWNAQNIFLHFFCFIRQSPTRARMKKKIVIKVKASKCFHMSQSDWKVNCCFSRNVKPEIEHESDEQNWTLRNSLITNIFEEYRQALTHCNHDNQLTTLFKSTINPPKTNIKIQMMITVIAAKPSNESKHNLMYSFFNCSMNHSLEILTENRCDYRHKET